MAALDQQMYRTAKKLCRSWIARFSLLIVAALLIFYIAVWLSPQEKLLRRIQDKGGTVFSPVDHRLSFLLPQRVQRKLCGDGRRVDGIWLDRDVFSDEDVRSLKLFGSLDSVFVNSANITNEGLSSIKKLGLLSLHIGPNCAVGIQGIKGFTGLVELHLEGEAVNIILAPDAVSELASVQSLRLGGDNVTDDVLQAACNLPALRYLWVHDSVRVSDESIQHVAALDGLVQLGILNCPKITDKSVDIIAQNHTLSQIYVEDCGLSETGKEVLRKQFGNNADIR